MKGAIMIFRYTILYVPDVPAALDFYERAFGLTRSFLHESEDYGELATGETKLAFSSLDLMAQIGKKVAPSPEAPAFEIAFETDDVAGGLKLAPDAGAALVQDVEHMPWGQTTAYVRAPEGTLVEICTAVQAA
jgi:catechol 2,3-dioxygenase-like lactoylglutathione lyase family enzyme